MENNKQEQATEILIKAFPERYRDIEPDFDLYTKVKNQHKSFLLTGTVGTGKTRKLLEILLADMISNFEFITLHNFDDVIVNKNPSFYTERVKKRFLTVPNVLRLIRESFNDKKNLNVVDNMINIDVLYLDDLGTENASEWVKEQLYLVLNERYNWNKPIIVTTNLNAKEIAENYGERFASRLVEMCEIIKFTGKDRRTEK